MLCLFREIAVAIADFGTDIFSSAFAFLLSSVRLCRVILPFGIPLSSAGPLAGLSADYRSEGRLIQSPPGRGSEPCRFNPESRVTGGVSASF